MHSLLVVATHNSHKTVEIREMVGDFFDEVIDLNAWPEIPHPEENGSTFEENSEIKACGASDFLPEALIVADDSGLEVDALNGAPGVISARYAGLKATDAENRRRLLTELVKVGAHGDGRTGRFRCVLTVMKRGEKLAVFSGSCEGSIASEEKGAGGFGYDSLFLPQGFEKTFGELPDEVKNQLSHRSKAMAQFKNWIRDQRQMC